MANNPLNESWFDVPNTLLGMGQNLLFHINYIICPSISCMYGGMDIQNKVQYHLFFGL
jgi:hypothetical protein